MRAAQEGDGQAYEALLLELLPFVRALVRERMGRDPAATEDVVQEVLLSIHTARHTYRPERPLRPWVRAIARNAVIDWSRWRTRRREVTLEGIELADPRGHEPSGNGRLSPSLERALASLPDGQRQAVLLLKVQGLSVAEAALRAGISPGALKLRAHRGYLALRRSLGVES